MSRSPPTSLTFYPAYCFSVSPTFCIWAKLTAADVHALKEREGFEGQKIYFHLNHPIKYVRLVGVIVAFEDNPYRWIFHLDDSSGATIEVTCPRERGPPVAPTSGTINVPCPHASNNGAVQAEGTMGRTVTGNIINMRSMDLGSVVKVKGGISEFRGEKQITLERITLVPTTTAEAIAWTELHHFSTTILSKPWHVSADEEQRLKAEADGSRRRAEEKLQRKVMREAHEVRKKQRADREAHDAKRKRRAEREAVKEARKPKRMSSDKENHGA